MSGALRLNWIREAAALACGKAGEIPPADPWSMVVKPS